MSLARSRARTSDPQISNCPYQQLGDSLFLLLNVKSISRPCDPRLLVTLVNHGLEAAPSSAPHLCPGHNGCPRAAIVGSDGAPRTRNLRFEVSSTLCFSPAEPPKSAEQVSVGKGREVNTRCCQFCPASHLPPVCSPDTVSNRAFDGIHRPSPPLRSSQHIE